MKDICIIGKIKKISQLSDKFLEKRIKEENLPLLRSHIPIFYILPSNCEKMLFNDIAKLWNISKSSLSDIINKYIKLGLVNKHTCFSDKRIVYISLTTNSILIKEKLTIFEDEFRNILLKDFEINQKNIFDNTILKALNNLIEEL